MARPATAQHVSDPGAGRPAEVTTTTTDEPGGVYARDAEGRRFRVRFDPATRIAFDARYALANADAGANQPTFGFAIAHRYFTESGADDTFVSWQVENRFVETRLRPWETPFRSVPGLDAGLWSGSFRRHTADPYLTIPTSPPRRLPFPFDIGIDSAVGRLAMIAPDAVATEQLRVGVLRAVVFLDPIRSGTPGTGVEIGVGMRYDLDVWRPAATTNDRFEVVHRVAPMSAVYARVRWQDTPGLTWFDLRGELVPHWASTNVWQTFFESSARFERTLVAINDMPLGLFVSAGYAAHPKLDEPATRHEWTASAGCVFGVPLN